MFTNKKSSLFSTPKRTTSVTTASKPKNKFVQAAMKKQAETKSGNSALKYETTGNVFVDQFSKVGTYKTPRSYTDIEKDCEQLWANNKLLCVCFILYLRMVPRIVQLFDGTSTSISQKGAELKHEGIMRMIWLSQRAPRTFMKNIGLFISVGGWKDIIIMLQYDLIYHGWDGRVLNWNEIGDLILSGLAQDNTSELVKKYLPQIKANSACTTVESQADNMIAKWICSLLYGNKESSTNYKKYRKMKSGGTAHQWQQLISQKKFKQIDFNKIHGRALNKLVRGKFLANNGLTDAYAKWIGKETTKAKYTGFVHELFMKLPTYITGLPQHEQDTINKQFEEAVRKAKDVDTETRFIAVRDTSGSMGSKADGTDVSSNVIAKAITLYFSYFLEGPFKDAWIEFASDAEMRTWMGKTPLDKWYNDRACAGGGTNFQSVIQLFARLKRQGLDEKDFPTGIICISDQEFNAVSLGKTNVQAAHETLRKAGFSEKFVKKFVIVLWNIPNSFYGFTKNEKVKFETYGDTPNVFYLSGYSPSIISFLMTGKATNAEELFREAMNQEVLNMIEL